MKTIKVSGEVHFKLLKLGSESETYNDIIERLIIFYENEHFEDFSEEKAQYYNGRIRLFESGNYAGMREVDLNSIKSTEK